MNKLCCW